MNKKNLAFLSLFIVIVFLGAFTYFLKFTKSKNLKVTPNDIPSPTISQSKPFKSSNLDFTVNTPQGYEIEEDIISVEFRKGRESISTSRNDATGFENLTEYLNDIDEKNKTEEISEIRELKIDGYPTRVREEKRGQIKFRFYYIYVDGWVYVFSTPSESLYSNLDQIVQSFRYTPD